MRINDSAKGELGGRRRDKVAVVEGGSYPWICGEASMAGTGERVSVRKEKS